MATSGSTDYNNSRIDIVTDAFRAIGVGVDGEPLAANDRTYAERTLNRMVKGWDAHGDHLWKREEIVVYLTVGEPRYQLGTGGDKASLLTDTVVTKLNGVHAVLATTFVVDSTTGMAAADNIGVVVDDGSIHWTTIVSVDSATGLTITTGIDDAASDDAVVYTYTSAIPRPLKLVAARRRDHTATTPIDSPITMMLSRQEYQELPQKSNQGIPTQAYYDPQLSLGELYVWNAPESSSSTLDCTAHFPMEDMDAANNNPDVPQEWLEAMVFGLARRLMTRYPPQDPNIRAEVRDLAQSTLNQALNFDSEPGSIFFQPDFEGAR